MNQIQKINNKFKFYQFGPVIAGYQLSKQFANQLYEKGLKTNFDYTKSLAGHLKNEFKFSENDMIWFTRETSEIFNNYINYIISNSIHESRKNKIHGYKLHSLWINFMKKGDFNPIHTHSGDISFVIYLSVPDEIILEENNFQGLGAGPGSIGFFYGEESISYKSQHHFIPQTGDMYLFPSNLRHYVPPFKADVTRISVSGNIFFT